jgi:hypothetical protein
LSAVLSLASVAKGPKFLPKSTKRAEKNLTGPGSQGPNFIKKGPKRAQLFLDLVFHQIIYIFCQNCTYKLVYLILPFHFGS